ncbi:MAG: hypothetical protein HY815_22170 [Candidatus Riflebacteria bacterium]|nr:hypothetical protein [Candidatus Riflebacteria bacterium]
MTRGTTLYGVNMPDDDRSPKTPDPLVSFVDSSTAFEKGQGRCPVCREKLAETRQLRVCPRCQTPHHLECWEYNGACGVFGCAAARPAGSAAPRRDGGEPDAHQRGTRSPVPVAWHSEEVPPRRSRITIWELLIVLAIIGVLAAIAIPNFRAARERPGTRGCYASQKTVAGAIEMYNLDKNTRRTLLDGDFWSALKSGGYLMSIPQDEGQGPGSSANFAWTAAGNGIKCSIHGCIQ